MTHNSRIISAGVIVLLFAGMFSGAAASETSQPGYIKVGTTPVAQFDAHYAFATVPTNVIFVDNSRGSAPLTYQWDFGDGATSTEPNPTHTYTTRGSFTVKLTVTNVYGSSTETKYNFISIGMEPKSAFTAQPENGKVPMVVKFTDQSEGRVESWVWDFGDGERSTEKDPVHTYLTAGTYNVMMTASNEYGSSETIKPGFITVAGPLKSKFTANPTSGHVPVTVKFSDNSLGSPTSWNWDFGDGVTSTEQNPTHTFTKGNRYEIKLEIERAYDTDASTHVVSFGEVPSADFTTDQRTGNAPFIVQFTDISQGNPTKWTWQFGDGTTSSDRNPQHIYPKEGAYDVKLTVSNEYGSDTVVRNGSAVETIVPTVWQTPVVTQVPTTVKTTVKTVEPTKTKTSMSPITTIAAMLVGLLALAITHRK
jgi:PKD repeat protein